MVLPWLQQLSHGDQTGCGTPGECDDLSTMTPASHTHGLGVFCVVLTAVVAGEKLQFVLRVFLLSVKFGHPAAGCFRVQWCVLGFGGTVVEWLSLSSHTKKVRRSSLDSGVCTGSMCGSAFLTQCEDIFVKWIDQSNLTVSVNGCLSYVCVIPATQVWIKQVQKCDEWMYLFDFRMHLDFLRFPWRHFASQGFFSSQLAERRA